MHVPKSVLGLGLRKSIGWLGSCGTGSAES